MTSMQTRPSNPAWRMAAVVAAFVAYAGFNLAAAMTGADHFSAFGLLLLITVLLWPALRAMRKPAWCLWLLATAALVGALWAGEVPAVMDTLAVIINAAVGWVFARTLWHGREPLITQVVRRITSAAHLEEPGVRSYTRTLTAVWAAILWLQAAVLAVVWWLLHVGVPFAPAAGLVPWLEGYLRYASYLLVPLVFAIEYPVRCYRMPNVERPPFTEMLRRVATDWQQTIGGRPS